MANRCLGQLYYETFAGFRIYTELNGKRLYKRKCSKCGFISTGNGEARVCYRKLKDPK